MRVLSSLLLLVFSIQFSVSVQQILMAYDLGHSEIADNPDIEDFLSFGAQYTVERGIQAEDFVEANYQLTRIYRATRYLDDDVNAKTYKFSVEFLNSEGSVFSVIFEVFSLSESGIKYVESYDYSKANAQIFASLYRGKDLGEFDFLPMDLNPKVNALTFVPFAFNTTVNGENELFREGNLGTDALGWAHLDMSDIKKDPEMRSLINFGIQEFLQQEVDLGNLADGQYQISHVYSVMRRLSKEKIRLGQMDNSFEIELNNTTGPNIRANLVIPSRPQTGGSFEILKYTYMDMSYDPHNFSDFELNTIEQAEYLQLDASAADNDPKIKEALDFGVEGITYGGIKISRLPEDQYDITQINSLYVKDTNYRFDVELSNCAGLKMRAVYIIYSSEQNNSLELLYLHFRIIDIPPQGLIGDTCVSY